MHESDLISNIPSDTEIRRHFTVSFHRSFDLTDEVVVLIEAIALLHKLWRNTEAIENGMHAGQAEWGEGDMMRSNAWLTKRFAEILRRYASDRISGEEWSGEKMANCLGEVLLDPLPDGWELSDAQANWVVNHRWDEAR